MLKLLRRADKIRMTKKEIDRAYQTTQKFLSGSISYENLIKDLRGTDIITVVILVILFNWYNSFFEPVAGFVPPHMDPIGWLTNKYDNSHQNQSQAYPPISI